MAAEVNDVSNTEESLILKIKLKIERLEGSVRKCKERVKNFQIVNHRSLLKGDKKITVLTSQIKSVKVKLKKRKKKLQELKEKGKYLESQNICRMRKAAFENQKGNNLLDQNKIRGGQNKNHRNSNKEARPPNVEVLEDELPINYLPLQDAVVPPYICPRCQSSFEIFLQFSLHKHLCRSTAELHQCPVCLEEFEDIQAICIHLQDHEHDEESDEGKVFEERPDDDGIGTDNCKDNDLDKSSAVSIVSPARSSHSNSSPSVIPPEKLLRRHIDYGIKSSNLLQCSVCRFKFSTLKSLKCHEKNNHPELIQSSKILNCTNCQTGFASRVSLSKHEMKCKSKIQVVVENPDELLIVMSNKEASGDKQFSVQKLKPKSPPELEIRLNNSTIAKKLFPQIGSKSSRKILVQHHQKQKTVSKELLASTKYNCKFCEESLAKWKDFEAHAKIHPEGQGISKKIPGRASLKLQCSECEKEFSNQDSVFSHFLVMHAWLKPFHCNKCSLSFCTAYVLSRHKNQKSHLDSESSAVDSDSDFTINPSDEFSTDDDSD